MRSPASVVVGNEGVIAATMATLAEFPDRTLLAEDVIWSGDERRPASCRRTGCCRPPPTAMTAPTARRPAAPCDTGSSPTASRVDNQIADEWLVRDQGAIVRQLGIEPKRYAAGLIADAAPGRRPRPLTPDIDPAGPYAGTGNDDPWGERYAGILTGLMAADLASIPAVYDRGVQLEMPGGVTGHGWAAADGFWMRLRSAFPSAEFRIHHRIGREDPLMPPRAALRWSLWGKHDGFGAFGPPTGAPVYILGISHAEFGPRGLRREWVLYDETAIWTQIALHTG